MKHSYYNHHLWEKTVCSVPGGNRSISERNERRPVVVFVFEVGVIVAALDVLLLVVLVVV